MEVAALPGVRLYRTGDWVTLGRDGQLRYHGRHDGQVKVRGHRVELNAVRSALCSLPGVRDAFVVAGAESAGALTAHVAAEGLGVAEIQEGVRRLIPPYAVPSVVHVYDALPLKSSGKVDVTRLRSGDGDGAPEEGASNSPHVNGCCSTPTGPSWGGSASGRTTPSSTSGATRC
ncbi:hypothetical protein ABMX48_11505 [Streptomyces cavourensis]